VKNQYVGDVNDFVKYGLIRALTADGQRSSFVAWLLTPDDERSDGRRLGYLESSSKWRHRDPELFDSLHTLVQNGERSVESVATSGIIPGARYYADFVPQACDARRHHFEHLLRLAAGRELIFFDPDNGLEIASCPSGRKDSPKYLLWRELIDSYLAGHSVLIYQHFPRRAREEYITAMSERIAGETGANDVLAFRTSHVVFFLATQGSETAYYTERVPTVLARWESIIVPAVIPRAVNNSSTR